MTSYNDIRDALMTKIATKYPSASIYGEEIQQSLDRPAFYIQLLPETGSNLNSVHREKNILIDLCYFSDDTKPERDAWKIADELDDLLGSSLAVGDRVFTIMDPEPDIVEGVLHYQFRLEFVDSRDGITIALDAPGETVTIPIDARQEALGYIDGDIELMRELEVKEEFK